MKNLFLSTMVLLALLFTSCTKDRISGSGSTATENRTVSNFSAVRTNGSSNVTVIKGNNFNVDVTGYQNLLSYFDTKVVNGTLVIGYRNNVHVRNDNISVTVTMPVLSGLAISGSGNITTTGNFTGISDFEATISGSGNINIQQGTATHFNSRISGSGDIHAFGMTAEKADVQVSGSGNTRISATAELKVKISGSGNVYYKGTPNLSVSVSGSGGVVKQ